MNFLIILEPEEANGKQRQQDAEILAISCLLITNPMALRCGAVVPSKVCHPGAAKSRRIESTQCFDTPRSFARRPNNCQLFATEC